MIHYRPHRMTLADSMREVIELPNERALRNHVEQSYRGSGTPFDASKLVIRPLEDDDVRIGWRKVHVVSAPSWGIIGFCTFEPVAE